jgi:aminoglycoside phosphotransferase (APT) family kinase protein
MLAVEEIRSGLERYCRTWRGDPTLRVTAVTPIPQGHSGFTYFVDLALDGAGERYVMRLPPPGARIAGPADVVRQGRIMAALHEQGLPVPAVPVICPDPVLDGRPFILTEVVNGVRIEDTAGRYPDRQIAGSAVEVLRRLHAVPLERTGIGTEEPQPLEAEMMRWAWLMERAPEELTGRAPVLGGMLAEMRPQLRQPVLVHGDFHYGNMLFRDGLVVALLDWEIAQIGQPLLDLACLSVVARSSRMNADSVPGGGNVVVPEELLVEAYGAPADEFDWYLALTFYKYAAIFGYNLMLHRRGKRPDPIYEERTGTIVEFIEEGISILDRGRR